MSSHQVRARTADVSIDGSVTFQSFHLSNELGKVLKEMGIEKPSPIQVQTIPVALLKKNVIAQSKSGTGKTLSFGIPALQLLNQSQLSPQVLILSPTRELAAQTHSVLLTLGQHLPGLHCHLFIGGMSFDADIKNLSPCNVVVGTPGRVFQLIRDGYLLTNTLRLFILDEADKMLQEGALKDTTLSIMNMLPQTIQHLCLSATYSKEMLQELDRLIPAAEHLLLAPDSPSLEGVKQYYLVAPSDLIKTPADLFTWKFNKLVEILQSISFHQCIVFCNAAARSSSLVEKLNAQGWATRALSAQLTQKERLAAVSDLREFRLRILLSSDLVARGLDIERINLVVNLDLPRDAETYLHRVGRTGRFGTFGVAISLLGPTDLPALKTLVDTYHSSMSELPETIPPDFYHYELSEVENAAKKRLDERTAQRAAKAAAEPAPPKPKDNAKTKNAKKRKRDYSPLDEDMDDEEEWAPVDAAQAAFAPPPPPQEFWNATYYVHYITECYLPSLQQAILELEDGA